MSETSSFAGCSIVSCATLRNELEQLVRSGCLDADKILYVPPGLHEWPDKFEQQVPRRLRAANEISNRVIVVYGSRCFVDTVNPQRTTDALIGEQGMNATRIDAANCVDMLASKEEREQMSGGQNVLWLTPGWIRHWDFIFKDWDIGKYNEMFPRYDKAVVLDALGYLDEVATESPERVLEISDRTHLPIESCAISLERLSRLLAAQVAAVAR
ncbi:MAG TPA: DUF1638 domain-containing protein [Candidatus Hydrogenedentes bacterium]|nr:DUF1638 domain-containing protein [Candidatus Hydrogenedentota bacterium]